MLSFKKIITKNKPIILAHRGVSALAHENTIDAFDIAVELKCDAIELDIRKTKDNQLVVHHDPSTKKNRKSLKKLTYNEIIKFNRESDFQIPTFEETCKHLAGKIALDIELKESGYEGLVVETALRYYRKENVLFTSFKKKSLYAIKEIDKDLFCGYLINPKNSFWFKNIYSFDYLLPHHSLCQAAYLKKLNKFDKPLITWTLDNKKRGEKLYDNGIIGIITNNPFLYKD